ncbi:EAL domain-containing protein [Candidatus Accumulibacter vicinus]|uniref:Cyclic di-GMP phosphodiesterase Gmr n=1 Tax=Candidatus Accumulibacter vicinus TaxID=2954382 RepID=A0A084XXU0_9PROT|nr:EAL domain-containing protein [Candidatus Accumulibacter vicinus]KFB67284.1 MAG: Cyclic di-GMP phosphodiesterase Gmr [Candidatus Accumulibacter vicinus]
MIATFKASSDWSKRILVSLLLTVAALLLSESNLLHRWNLFLYDWNRMAWSRAPADDIVIVAIDEQSLREIGRWPWSRRIHAQLTRQLTAAEARVIGLDIVFAEPETSDPGADAELATALAANGRVVLPVLNEQHRLGEELRETLPIPLLQAAAAGIGHVDVELDLDGIARSVFLKAGLGSSRWPTLALAMLELSDPAAERALPGERAPHTAPPSPDAWHRDYRILIPFVGPPGRFRHFSYRDVLRGDYPPATFRGKFVLVGATASGMADALPTPVSAYSRLMPGVEYNANVLDALRQGLTIQPLPDHWTLLLTGVLVFFPMLLHSTCPARWTLPVAVLSLLLTLISSFALLYARQLWFPPGATLLVQGLGCPLWSWQRLRLLIRSLFEQEKRAQVALHSIGDAVITTDANGAVQYLNPVAESLLGAAPGTLRGQELGSMFQVADEHERYRAVNLVALCLEAGALVRLPEPSILRNQAGEEYAIRASAAPIHDPQMRITGVVIAFSNITETRRLTEQMRYQANHDALTHLPNLDLLRDRLKHAIARARRSGQSLALLFVDLDQFKKINEGLGHSAGDALLRAVADRLLLCGRKDDTIVRVGGDEFICMLEDLRQEDRVVDFAHKLLRMLETPFQIGNNECVVTASIGICLFPKDGGDVETLLRNADTAMYRAKERGRNNIQFYAHDMHLRSLERLNMEQDLRHALARQELEIHYQPQMDLRQGRIIGVEALLRWRHPRRGLISPLDFVPLAEETGLIESIGEWVLRTACRQAKAWQQNLRPTLRMAVNLSPRQFLRPGMVSMIAEILRETGLEPCYLDLEITESLLMKDVQGSITTMHALKAIGVRLSIDDFGTGYSSLNYLKQFPIDQLKIDKSFVHDLVVGKDDASITLAIIAMAHSMSLTVIAEGVESEAQKAFLRANQCDEIQGYHLSRPLPAGQIPVLLK